MSDSPFYFAQFEEKSLDAWVVSTLSFVNEIVYLIYLDLNSGLTELEKNVR